jgi:hypothetical protein
MRVTMLALFGELRRMGHKRKRPSFETPRNRAAPQDDGGTCGKIVIARSEAKQSSSSARLLDCFASLAMTQTFTVARADKRHLTAPS